MFSHFWGIASYNIHIYKVNMLTKQLHIRLNLSRYMSKWWWQILQSLHYTWQPELFKDFCIVLIISGEPYDVTVHFVSCTAIIEDVFKRVFVSFVYFTYPVRALSHFKFSKMLKCLALATFNRVTSNVSTRSVCLWCKYILSFLVLSEMLPKT